MCIDTPKIDPPPPPPPPPASPKPVELGSSAARGSASKKGSNARKSLSIPLSVGGIDSGGAGIYVPT